MTIQAIASETGIDSRTLGMVHAPQGIEDRLREAVAPLQKIPGFVSAAITRRDGLAIHHTFRSAREAAGLSAMAAAMVGAARATGAELGKGLPEYALLRFSDGILLIQDAGPEAILACLMEPDADIGYALRRILQASRSILTALEEM